jgi:hypothetical protein
VYSATQGAVQLGVLLLLLSQVLSLVAMLLHAAASLRAAASGATAVAVTSRCTSTSSLAGSHWSLQPAEDRLAAWPICRHTLLGAWHNMWLRM